MGRGQQLGGGSRVAQGSGVEVRKERSCGLGVNSAAEFWV